MEINDFYWFANRNHRESRDGSHAVGVGGEHILALGIGGTATVVAKGAGVGDEQCKKERENKGRWGRGDWISAERRPPPHSYHRQVAYFIYSITRNILNPSNM